MRISQKVLASFLTLALVHNLNAAEPPQIAPEILSSIDQLGSPQFRTREAASKRLITIAAPAIEPLRLACKSNDAEVRERAEAIVRKIETNLRNESLTKAPMLRLKFTNVPLNVALAEVSKKTGLPLVLDESKVKNVGTAITIDTGEVPFWQAVEQFMDAAGLTENLSPDPTSSPPQTQNQFGGNGGMNQFGYSGIAFQPQDLRIHLKSGKPCVGDCNRIVRVFALPKEHHSHVQGSNELVVMLHIVPTPNCLWQGLLNIDINEAIDDRNVVLKRSYAEDNLPSFPWVDYNFQGMGLQGQGGIAVWNSGFGSAVQPSVTPNLHSIRLLAKDSGSKSLKSLEGVITARVLSPAEPMLTIDDVSKAIDREVTSADAYSVKVLEANPGKGLVRTIRARLLTPQPPQQMFFPVRVPGGAMRPFLAIQQRQSLNGVGVQLVLQDKTGKQIGGVSQTCLSSEFSPSGTTMEFELKFNTQNRDDASPLKLSLVGQKNVDVKIPFVLKNVQLP